MTRTRSLSALAVVSLAALASLGVAGSAQAATPDTTYVTASDFTPFSDLTPGWRFDGTTPTSDVSGLSVEAGTEVDDLLATHIAIVGGSGTALSDFGSNSSLDADQPVAPSILALRDGSDATTLIALTAAAGADISDPTTVFTTVFGVIDTIIHGTLAQFDAAMAADPGYSNAVIVGVAGISSANTHYYDATVNGTLSSFLPVPAPVVPATVPVATYTTSGVTITTTGLVPNAPVTLAQSHGNSGGPVATSTSTAAGAVTFTYADPAAKVGDVLSFSIVQVDTNSAFIQRNRQDFTITVTAAAAAAATTSATLAATGAPATGSFVLAGLLLAAGIGLTTVAAVRRRAV